MENRYYVYAFLDSTKKGEYVYEDLNLSFDYEPFYIGKGTGNRIYHSQFDKATFKRNKINKIKRNGGEVILVKIYDSLSNDESFEKEINLIKRIGRRDLKLGTLVNITDGGEGRVNCKNSYESIQKMIQSKKLYYATHKFNHSQNTIEKLRILNIGEKNPMYGKTHTQEVRDKHSDLVSGTNHPMYGKKHNEETIQKIKENRNKSMMAANFSEISRERNSKKISQYTLEGEFIKEYDSIKIASEETGMTESAIGRRCRGLVKTPSVFIFEFSDNKGKIMKNSFVYKEGDKVTIKNVDYELIKRNKASCIVKDSKGEELSFKKKDTLFIWDKRTVN